MTDAQRKRWAQAAVKRKAEQSDWMGCSFEEASKRSVALCAAGAEAGITINVASYLEHFDFILRVMRPAA